MPVGHSAEVPLRQYASVLWHRKRFVLLGLIMAVGPIVGLSATQARRYTAQADILLLPPSQPLISQANQQQLTPADVSTQAAVVTSGSVTAAVAKMLGSAPSVSVSEVGQTNLISVQAIEATAARAAEVANAYAAAYITVRRQGNVDALLAEAQQIQNQTTLLDQQARAESGAQHDALVNQEAAFKAQLAQLQGNAALSTGDARIVTTAQPPSSPSSPRPKRDAAIGIALGLLLGVGFAVLVDYLDDAIYASETLERLAPDLPVLGLIPAVKGWKDRKWAELVSVNDPLSPAAEAYRSLRTSVQFLSLDNPVRVLQVTSPSAGEGKTTTAVNLGVSLANTGLSALIVDCDLRHPRVHQFFGFDHLAGFTSILLGQTQLSEAIRPAPNVPNLSILPSGPIPANPSEVLSTQRATDLIKAIRDQFDVVIIDSPPVLPVTDSAVLAKEVDGTLVVVAAGDTSRRHLNRGLELLRVVGAPLVGFSLNNLKGRRGGYGYGYGNRYGYGYGYAPTVERGPEVPITPGSPMMTTTNGERRDGTKHRLPVPSQARMVASAVKARVGAPTGGSTNGAGGDAESQQDPDGPFIDLSSRETSERISGGNDSPTESEGRSSDGLRARQGRSHSRWRR
jgi:polysaccharide biosynthesis transport protein